METNRRIISSLLVAGIKLYQWVISPVMGQHCRFYPTCSAYAMEAIQRHGVLRGCGLAMKRLVRCHPWHPGGVDWVPPATKASTVQTDIEIKYDGT